MLSVRGAYYNWVDIGVFKGVVPWGVGGADDAAPPFYNPSLPSPPIAHSAISLER